MQYTMCYSVRTYKPGEDSSKGSRLRILRIVWPDEADATEDAFDCFDRARPFIQEWLDTHVENESITDSGDADIEELSANHAGWEGIVFIHTAGAS